MGLRGKSTRAVASISFDNMASSSSKLEKTSSSSSPPSTALNALEAASWLFCTMIYFTWYNPVGEIAKSWDNGNSIFMRIDNHLEWMEKLVPYVPAMIFPYVAVYAMPLAYLLSLSISSHGLDLARVRRFFLTQILLITTAFLIYILAPVRTDLLWNPATQQHEYGAESWIGRLCYKHVHQGISLYVACPSMHTAHAFSIAAAFVADKLHGARLACLLAVVTLFSTTMTKAHPPPHLAFGLLLAYAGHHLIFRPLTHRMSTLSHEPATWARFYIMAMAPVAFVVAGEKLHQISGWSTDIPAMFGFESNPVLGLYGFRA